MNKQATEILQGAIDFVENYEGVYPVHPVVAGLRELLARSSEPVAYMDNDGNISDHNDFGTFNIPLYTQPTTSAQPLIKYVPVDGKLENKYGNHPNDDEVRTPECRQALKDRGDDRGQGICQYWKWGFASGFNAALAAHGITTSPEPKHD